MDIIETATGKKFGTDEFLPSDNINRCYIRILNTPLMDVMAVFSNPEETKELKYGNKVVKGYTVFKSVNMEEPAIRVTLTR